MDSSTRLPAHAILGIEAAIQCKFRGSIPIGTAAVKPTMPIRPLPLKLARPMEPTINQATLEANQAALEAFSERRFDRSTALRKVKEMRDRERAATAGGQPEAAAAARADRVAVAMRLRAHLGIEFDQGALDRGAPGGWRATTADPAPGIAMYNIDEDRVGLRIGTETPLQIRLRKLDADSRVYVLPWQLTWMANAGRIADWIEMTLRVVDAARLAGPEFDIERAPTHDLVRTLSRI